MFKIQNGSTKTQNTLSLKYKKQKHYQSKKKKKKKEEERKKERALSHVDIH